MSNSLLTLPVRAAPFDALAETYDEVFTNSRIGRAQRHLVWRELERIFHPGERLLELNCGTGVDAMHLAERGVEVLACDMSSRMIDVARRRLSSAELRAPVSFRVLATEEIRTLEDEGSFDGVFSNFGGLNCVEDLSAVARDLACLLRPQAKALLCIAGSFVAGEVVWYLAHGNPRKAFRRLRRSGVEVRLIEGVTVHCHYPSVRALARMFAPNFRLKEWRGVGVAVPPSYFESLAQRFPCVMTALEKADPWFGRCPLLRGIADHVLLTFERVAA